MGPVPSPRGLPSSFMRPTQPVVHTRRFTPDSGVRRASVTASRRSTWSRACAGGSTVSLRAAGRQPSARRARPGATRAQRYLVELPLGPAPVAEPGAGLRADAPHTSAGGDRFLTRRSGLPRCHGRQVGRCLPDPTDSSARGACFRVDQASESFLAGPFWPLHHAASGRLTSAGGGSKTAMDGWPQWCMNSRSTSSAAAASRPGGRPSSAAERP